ncbi:MAG: sulfatase-like hydrolase/transferase [Armatimonadetes bacterium]|nr:sulfatase-like hydrolase/transferase [Armatimonadota bacterium]
MTRPNILLITADHMRNDAVGANGNPFIRTPNLDALARRGVTFTNASTPNPICVPGRACITTGNYSHKCTGNKNNSGLIRDDQIKIAEHFAGAGYWSCAVGKLHYVPYAPPGQPRLVHGFQHWEACESGRMIGQFDPTGQQRGIEDYHDYLRDVGWGGYQRAHGIGNNDVHAGPSAVPAEHHEEAWVASRSIANLEQHLRERPGQPFFMWSSFAKPHSPYDPPEPYNRAYDPREIPPPVGSLNLLADRDPLLRHWPVAYGWDRLSPEGVQYSRAHYFGMVTFQDEQIGRIIACLEQAGQLDNTVIVYTADHGDLLGDFGCFFKCNMFHGSVGIPLIMAGPGIATMGQSDALVGLQDILPTLAGLTGCALPREVDGIDVTSATRGLYVSQSLGAPHQRYMMRNKQYKFVYHELGGVEELYDEAEDPHELRNLAYEDRALALAFRSALMHWCRENGDEEIFDGDGLKVSDEALAEVKEFEGRRMGWRWY